MRPRAGRSLAVVVALAGWGSPGRADPPADEVRPYDRRLPGDASAPPATVVVDAATGAPVVGARVALP